MSPATPDVPLRRLSFGQTKRPDAWWLKPLMMFMLLTGFIVYSTWAAFQNAHYWVGPYLSPMYSPELFGQSPHAMFGPKPTWWPGFLPFSPALLILPFPAFFRVTCYYYRGAYYKSHWASPPACAVGKPQKNYRGEQKLPLILQNVHRYFLYAALVFLVFLSYDAYLGFFGWPDGFHINVGSLVLLVNVILLASYTFGCHSLRHLVGGGIDEMSRNPLRLRSWRCVSCFNRQHQLWALLSLVWVGGTDLYVRLLSMGVISDWRIL